MPAVMKKRFLTVLVLLWMGLIFWFSAQPSDDSEDMSLEAGKLAGQILIPEYEEWSQARQLAFAKKIDLPVRKLAHVTEYFLLAVSVSFPLYVYRVRGIWLLLLAGTICVGFACLDEYHQSFVAGRSPSRKDVMIDSIGIAAGVILMQIICFIGRVTVFRPLARKRKRA